MNSFLPELSIDTLPQWLAENGFAAPDLRLGVLGGGVSNIVLLAECGKFRLIVKQALGQLRVAETWCADRGRIFREADAMRWLTAPQSSCPFTLGHVPELVIEDRPAFSIAMQAAPPGAEMWKTKLMRGECNTADAHAAGAMLGQMIAASWNDPGARQLFEDQTVFRQLRLDPYYRFAAGRHPELAAYFQALLKRSQDRMVSLVHGDWSPKNLLIASDGMWAIDWEVVHFGDPSFDVAFLLSHLVLKSVAMPQWSARLGALAEVFRAALRTHLPPDGCWIDEAAFEHLPALLLARVDGKSPVEYLNPEQQERVRRLARDLILRPRRELRNEPHQAIEILFQ